jgi:2-keto-4-pentenoate hydratase
MADAIERAAQTLRDAYRGGAIPPLRDVMNGTDAQTAYAIQSRNTRFWQDQGRRIVGYKIGLTAAAVQKQLGVDQPDYGVLFDDMLIPNGGTLCHSTVLQPKAEAEIALILASDVTDPAVDAESLRAAAGTAIAAIEIVDSRIADWKITFADTVADNGSSAFFVLGDGAKAIDGLDLFSCGMVLEVNDQIVSLGAGAACLGHPLNAAAWLARAMVARGQPLKAGDILMTGALGPMVPIAPGDHVRASIGGLGLCSFDFAEIDR